MAREIEINESSHELQILIPRVGNWIVILLTGSWCLVWIGIFYSLAVEGLLLADSDFTWHIFVFFIAWVWMLRILLWHVNGKEKVTLNNEQLMIKRVGTFLTSIRKYEVRLIDEFHFRENDTVPWWSRLYGFGCGSIAFDYWERPEYFGQTLSRKDAEKIAGRLNDRINRLPDTSTTQ